MRQPGRVSRRDACARRGRTDSPLVGARIGRARTNTKDNTMRTTDQTTAQIELEHLADLFGEDRDAARRYMANAVGADLAAGFGRTISRVCGNGVDDDDLRRHAISIVRNLLNDLESDDLDAYGYGRMAGNAAWAAGVLEALACVAQRRELDD
jgi:hypothetical protein